MGKAYTISDQSKAHFITATVVDWIDVFTRKVYRDIIIDNLNFYSKNKGLIIYGFVVMCNHIHLIIQAENENLSDILRDFKKFTAKTILEKIQSEPESRREWMLDCFKKATETHNRNKHYQFWRYGNHAEEIYSEKFLWSKLDYIHMNPVKSGIVNKPQDCIYSSASNYIHCTGIIDITLADNPVIDTQKVSNFKHFFRYD
jgi:REP element-mobilizing transposase RayT